MLELADEELKSFQHVKVIRRKDEQNRWKIGESQERIKIYKENQVRAVKTLSKIINSLEEFISRLDIYWVAWVDWKIGH